MFYIENAWKYGQSDRIGCLLFMYCRLFKEKLRTKRMPNEGGKIGLCLLFNPFDFDLYSRILFMKRILFNHGNDKCFFVLDNSFQHEKKLISFPFKVEFININDDFHIITTTIEINSIFVEKFLITLYLNIIKENSEKKMFIACGLLSNDTYFRHRRKMVVIDAQMLPWIPEVWIDNIWPCFIECNRHKFYWWHLLVTSVILDL